MVEANDILDVEVLPAPPPIITSRQSPARSLTKVEEVKSSPARQPLATIHPSTVSPRNAPATFTDNVGQYATVIAGQEPERSFSGHGNKPHSPAELSQMPPNSKASKASLTDPAILSIRKTHSSGPHERHSASPSQTISLVSATLSEPFHNLSLSDIPVDQQDENGATSPPGVQESMQDGLNGQQESKKRRRRKRKRGGVVGKEASLPQVSTLPKFKTPGKSKPTTLEKRDSALVDKLGSEDSNGEYQPPRSSHAKVPKRQRPPRHRRVTSEWEAEDTSTIHQLPEFDFAANLSKFDKHTLFSRFKNDDTTADEARLVGHNRLARPGTNGGKNLHFTENVLDTSQLPPIPGKWSSEAGESELEGILEARTRTHSHRSLNSRLSSSRPTSSAKRDHDPPRSATSMRSNPRSQSSRPQPPTLPKHKGIYGPLYLTPLQSVEAEAFAVSHLGLSEDMMTENAARGIAEVIVRDLKDRTPPVENPRLIVFAGNHKTGARAISAGRHLTNRGIEVIATVLDSNDKRSTENFLPCINQALHALQMAGGKVHSMQTLLQALENPDKTAHILLDAVLGIHLQHSDFSPAAFQTTKDLIDVFQDSRRRRDDNFSIDVPFGRDANTGEISCSYGRSSTRMLWPRHVIFLGAPKSWREIYFRKEEDGVERIVPLSSLKTWVVDLGFDVERARGGGTLGRKADWGRPWVEKLDG